MDRLDSSASRGVKPEVSDFTLEEGYSTNEQGIILVQLTVSKNLFYGRI